MKEQIFYFGSEQNQFGILTAPNDDFKPSAPVAVILNAGIVHHIGPFRLHVNLARQLADSGFTTLRMDLSGLGESAARVGKVDSTENRAVFDVNQAMDQLSKQMGANEFVVIGLCSGAYNAHHTALADERIVGAVFLDGIVFRTVGYYLRNGFNRFTKPRFWRNAFKRRLSSATDRAKQSEPTIEESEFFTNEFTRAEITDHLHQMLARDMKMLFIYTDGYDDISGRAQFREMFGIKPDNQNVQVEYYDQSEHTFRIVKNRNLACRRIIDWYSQQFSTSQATNV